VRSGRTTLSSGLLAFRFEERKAMAELRHIEIPETVKILGNLPYPFVECVDFLIRTDHRFNDNGNGIRAGAEIKAEMKGKKPGDRATLDEPNWKLLHDVMEEPHGPEQDKRTGKWGVFSQTGTDRDGKEVVIGEYLVGGGDFLPYLEAVSEKGTQAVAEQIKAEAKADAKQKPKGKQKPGGQQPKAEKVAVKKPLKPIPDAIKPTATNGRAVAS
jgi:hypothetical protein